MKELIVEASFLFWLVVSVDLYQGKVRDKIDTFFFDIFCLILLVMLCSLL